MNLLTKLNFKKKLKKKSTNYNEQTLSEIIDSMTDLIIMIDENRNVYWANNKAKAILGPNIIGKKCYEVYHNSQQACSLCLSAKAFADGNFHEKETKIIDNQGKPRDVWSTVNIVAKHKNGSPKLIVEILRDITKKNKTKEKIEKLNEELEKKVIQRTWQLDQVNKKLSKVVNLKSKFISDASHELRTPLTIIQGNLDLAIRKAEQVKQEIPELFTVISKEIKQMADILSDLTMLTNADAQTEYLAYEDIDINKLIKEVVTSLKVLARPKNIKISIKKNKNNLFIKGSEAKIEKLLINIVRNAIKYTRKKGLITLSTDSSFDEVKIFIKDNGIGIPEQDLPYIFERFYRVDKARSRSEGGTGLGLSICKWIAESHGGHINVQSKMKQGTKFTIHLPKDYKKTQTTSKLF